MRHETPNAHHVTEAATAVVCFLLVLLVAAWEWLA